MLCPRCGVDHSGKFCSNCGFQLNRSNVQQNPSAFQQLSASSPVVKKKIPWYVNLWWVPPWYSDLSLYAIPFVIVSFFICAISILLIISTWGIPQKLCNLGIECAIIAVILSVISLEQPGRLSKVMVSISSILFILLELFGEWNILALVVLVVLVIIAIISTELINTRITRAYYRVQNENTAAPVLKEKSLELITESNQRRSPFMLCSRCGTEQSGKFCCNCGFQLSISNVPQKSTTFQRPDSSSPVISAPALMKKYQQSRTASHPPWFANLSFYALLLVILSVFNWILIIFLRNIEERLSEQLLVFGFGCAIIATLLSIISATRKARYSVGMVYLSSTTLVLSWGLYLFIYGL